MTTASCKLTLADIRRANASARSFAAGPIRVGIDHPDYLEVVELPESTRQELLTDLR